MKLTIQVTEEDIGEGVKSDCYLCPIARAMDRCTGGSASVWSTYAKIVLHGDVLTIDPLPQSARDFIANFDETRPDHRREPEPFSFEIELPNTHETEK